MHQPHYGSPAIDEARRQQALEALGVLDTPPDERVDRVTRLAQEIFGVPMVSVTLLDRDRQWRKSQIGLGGNEAPREDAFCEATARQTGTLVIEDAARDQVFAANPFVAGDPHLRFYAGHPLQAPGGEQIGTLCILDTRPRSLDPHQRALLQELALWVQTELVREQDLDHAVVVQRALSPRPLPPLAGWTVAAGSVAAGHLAGDFHDLYVRDGRLRVTLADVMGKGTGPALVASGVRASLRTAPDRPLTAAVTEIDALLEHDLGDTAMFVTGFHGELDLATGELEFVDAGHSLAFVLRADGGWEHLRATGLPLGMGGLGGERAAARVRLGPGDVLMCCSDGLLDILDPDDPFGHVGGTLRERGLEGAVEEARRLAEGMPAPDDVTVVVVRREA